jgi:pimeloyl-ACP methyl ester carboxylesterase
MRRVLRGVGWGILMLLLLVVCVLGVFRYQATQRENIAFDRAAPSTGRFVDAGDTRIFVQQLVDENNPAVLFVHGTGAWSGLWRTTLQRTANAGFHVIAIDLPPFGFSEKRANLNYSKAAQGQRIVRVLENLNVSRAILVGHSFGAGPTVEAAMLHPNRVAKLVIVDGALDIRKPGTIANHSALVHAALSAQPFRDAMIAAFVTNPAFTRKLMQMLVARRSAVSDEVVHILQAPMHVQGTTAAVGEWLPALIDSHTSAASQTPSEYAKLTMPVVLLWGELDSVTPMSQATRLSQLLPQAKTTILKNVGHIPQVEDPESFNSALLAALADRGDVQAVR